MELSAAAAAAPLPSRTRRLDGWSATSLILALLIAAPLLAMPLSFVLEGTTPVAKFSDLLPEALTATAALIAGVGAGTIVLGTALAALVAFCEFPGRSWIEWALALPLAMPGYVFTLFALGTVGEVIPQTRSIGGAIVIFTLVLYPYVYLLARDAFLGQSRNLFDAARSLGMSPLRVVTKVFAPLARPAMLAGALLAVMEALADFGTVNLLGVHTFTDAIYRVWFNAFDRTAAMQLGAMLASVTITLLLLERLVQRRSRAGDTTTRSAAVPRVRLRGLQAVAATAAPLLLLGVVVAAPLARLLVWAGQAVAEGRLSGDFAVAARNSLLFAGTAALIVALVALALAYGLRAGASKRAARGAIRVATIGYGLPGFVVAATVIVPLGWFDDRIADLAGALGREPGLLLTGTALGLFAAYLVRFIALAFQSVDASLGRVPGSLDEAARGLGADRLHVLWRVHLPLMRGGILTALLLVFSEVVKELPATMLLRPLGGDTLAIEVWQATSESLWETAALPALIIVAVGTIPIAALVRASSIVPK